MLLTLTFLPYSSSLYSLDNPLARVQNTPQHRAEYGFVVLSQERLTPWQASCIGVPPSEDENLHCST